MKQDLDMQRFAAIVDAYGGEPSRWPEEERSAALQFIADNPAAEALKSAAAELDQMLDAVEIGPPGKRLHESVLAALSSKTPVDLIDRLLDWLFPASGRHLAWLWRPAIAVTLPLTVGFILGAGSVTSASIDEWEIWEEEIYISGIVTIDSGTTISGAIIPGETTPGATTPGATTSTELDP